MASCIQKSKKEAEITAQGSKYFKETTYVLDTLSNGHIIMRDKMTRDAGFIDYQECPKCKENLKKTIVEVIDSMKDEEIIKMLVK